MDIAASKFISDKEETKLFKTIAKACPDKRAVVDLMLFQLLSLSGLRISEALDLQWEDIGEDYIRIKDQKNGKKNGTILIGNRLLKALEEFKRVNPYGHSSYLFNTQKGPYRRSNADMRLKYWLRVAELRDSISCHSFRHSYATKSLDNGIPLTFIKSQLRHANISTTSTYLHFTKESRDKVKDIF